MSSDDRHTEPVDDQRERLINRLVNPAMSRVERKRAVIRADLLGDGSEIVAEKRIGFDEFSQEWVDSRESALVPIACGCFIFSPRSIEGRCKKCARSWRVRWTRELRLVCTSCKMCLHCATREEKRENRTGVLQRLLTLALWLLCLDRKRD